MHRTSDILLEYCNLLGAAMLKQLYLFRIISYCLWLVPTLVTIARIVMVPFIVVSLLNHDFVNANKPHKSWRVNTVVLALLFYPILKAITLGKAR